MRQIEEKICGETLVAGFCALVFGVFLAVVVANLHLI
jgi:hypothetical protein